MRIVGQRQPRARQLGPRIPLGVVDLRDLGLAPRAADLAGGDEDPTVRQRRCAPDVAAGDENPSVSEGASDRRRRYWC
jgi:hypothetical protein